MKTATPTNKNEKMALKLSVRTDGRIYRALLLRFVVYPDYKFCFWFCNFFPTNARKA